MASGETIGTATPKEGGPSARRERERHEMRELILDAAMKLVTKEGYDKTTIRKIAEAIEYAPGAIYSYFKDKDDLFFALHERGFGMFDAEMTREVGDLADPADKLRAMARGYLKFALSNPEYYDLMFIDHAPARVIERCGGEWNAGLKSYERLRATVQECMDAGHLPFTHADVAAFAFWSAVHGMASLHLRNRCLHLDEATREILLSSSLELILKKLL